VRVLDESIVMGFGGRQGRGGSTSRHGSNEDSKEKKESKPSEVDISPDEIRKLVAKFLKELASNTNPKKAPRLLNLISEEKIRALAFMRKLKFVTDPEFKDKYIEAERRRKIWFDENGWEFTPNVDPTELPLMSYDTVADVNGQTEQVDEKHDAFVAFMGTHEGPLRLAEYDKMICSALLAAFGKWTTNSTIKMFAEPIIQVNGSGQILRDVMTYVGKVATVNHDRGDLESEELLQVTEVLLTGLEKKAPSLGLDMRAAMEGKGYPVAKYCELLVDKATQRMETTDAFADWEKDKSKGSQPLSDADRLRLNDLEKEVARLKKENERLLKAAKPNNPSTGASAVGNTGCFKCGKEGHRADQCPDNKPAPTKTAPATPKTSGAKSAGTSRKVSFSKLQLNTAVQEAVTKTVHETVAAMAKNGWQKS
jgi:hypothetical protein